MIEPELIKAGDKRVLLGYAELPPKTDVRVISEDNYQLLKQAFDLHNVSGFYWTDNDVDAAYLMGAMNAGNFDDLRKELDRLEKMNLKPHEAVAKVRGK